MEYRVWIEIEEADDHADHYVTVDTPGTAVASFDTHQEAWDFVVWLDRVATSSHATTNGGTP